MLNGSLSKAVSELKKNWLKVVTPDEIRRVCQKEGLEWRRRLLDPVTTIQLFLLQILQGNTSITHVRYFTSKGFSASAYCQARNRIPVRVLKTLLEKMSRSIESCVKESWHGRRLFLVDGSSFSMSDEEPLRNYFGQPTGQKVGCGFPIAHFLAMMHSGCGLIQEILPGKLYTNDLSSFVGIHSALKPRDVIVADNGFCSFAHLSLLVKRKVDAIFRLSKHQIVNFRSGRRHGNIKNTPRSRWEKKLGITDQLVTWFKPLSVPSWMTAKQYQSLPNELLLREIGYNVNQPGFRVKKVILVTTLLDEKQFPKEILEQAFRERWQIETNFNHLKTTMQMDILRCKTVDGVFREIYAFCIVYNLIRTIMMHQAESYGCKSEEISFKDALRWTINSCQTHCYIPILKIPSRPNRSEPRAKKRRPNQYDLLIKPRKLYKLEALNA
jgi:hypothetical protein